jgi:hypothetical protein
MPNLFGTPECELADGEAAAFLTDSWSSAWLCRSHLRPFLILQASIGRSLGSWLEEKRAA